jgi:ornithine carbamoyltransferase
MFDAIQFRGFKQETVETLAEYAGVPVYNGLTDQYHPTQILADLMTVQEEFGTFKDRKMAFVGDGRNNVANTLFIGCAKVGLDFTVVTPKELTPADDLLAYCRKQAAGSGARLEVAHGVEQGVRDADIIYTDVWISMGEEAKQKERLQLLRPYQVNEPLMARTGKSGTIFMHCLPAVKGNEVSYEVIEGPASRVWDESENRKHTIKALMLATI